MPQRIDHLFQLPILQATLATDTRQISLHLLRDYLAQAQIRVCIDKCLDVALVPGNGLRRHGMCLQTGDLTVPESLNLMRFRRMSILCYKCSSMSKQRIEPKWEKPQHPNYADSADPEGKRNPST